MILDCSWLYELGIIRANWRDLMLESNKMVVGTFYEEIQHSLSFVLLSESLAVG